jgi:hypothetical protein
LPPPAVVELAEEGGSMPRGNGSAVALAIGLSLTAAGAAPAETRTDTLTPAEKAQGWQLLFDGTTTEGWRSFRDAPFPKDRWSVEDGCLRAAGSGGGGSRHADIVTVGRFDDFDLHFDWRIAAGGNSGVKYLLAEARPIGHEYQLLDDLTNDEARVGRHRQTGSLYDVLPRAEAVKSRPAGEWNHSRIVVAGDHVEHWLNGAKVLEYELGSPALRSAIAGSKFRGVEGFGARKASPVLLQDHGSEVWFRNLRIRARRQ